MRIRINYVKNDKDGERFHVQRKEEFFLDQWFWIGKFKTLADAEEFGKSRDQSVIYEGIYENGKRIGMTAWDDEVEKNARKFPEAVNDGEITWEHRGKR